MKAIFKNSLNNNQLSKQRHRSLKQQEFNEHKYKNNINNNTIRPAQAISFSGSAVSAGIDAAAKATTKFGEKFVQNKTANKLIGFVGDNEAAYTAIYSLLVAGILKPMLVLKTKDADEKDKQIIATKNFLQAFIGSFLGFTVGGGIVKKAVDVIKNNIKLLNKNDISVVSEGSEEALELAESILKKHHKVPLKDKIASFKQAFNEGQGFKKITSAIKAFTKKVDFEPSQDAIKQKAGELVEACKKHKHIFEKNPEYLKNLADKIPNDKGTTLYQAYESFWKNSTGWITAIMKAKISSLLLPSVMVFLFAKRNLEKQQLEKELKEKNTSPLLNSKTFQKEQEQFSSFLNKTSQKNISFTGKLTDIAIEKLAMGVENLSMSKPGEKLVKTLQRTKKPSARMADVESILLTTYWVQNTTRSKKIDPDQKLGLNTQSVLVTLVSSATAFILDALLDGLIDKGEKSYTDVLTSNIKKLAQEIKNGKEVTDMKAAIQESCSKLLGAEEIAKTFVKKKINIDDAQAVKEVAEKLAGNYKSQLSKFKSLTIFTLVVRFLVPVLMVKPAGKLKQKIKVMQQQRREMQEKAADKKEVKA